MRLKKDGQQFGKKIMVINIHGIGLDRLHQDPYPSKIKFEKPFNESTV
jgi:hypothetical protein